MSRKLLLVLLLTLLVSIALYTFTAGREPIRVRVATTTSLYATGLLDYLADKFKEGKQGVEIDFIAVGSGEALRRAERGDACLVFVHAPSLEKEYIEKGVIVGGRIFAYNYFVVVGPRDDPAGIRESENAVEAFKKIYSAGEKGLARFVSRGDNSGTHVKELSIWSRAGLDPTGREWYLETGQGMAHTLLTANELAAYTLSDIGTFLKLRSEGRISSLEVLYSNSTELINIYSIYLVGTCSGDEKKVAEEFTLFVLSNQELIEKYGVEDYGQPLFYPARGREDELKKYWELLAGP